MNIPFAKNLPTSKLASVFNNTSATYKFYWLLSIVELVEHGVTEIPKEKIFARMISNSWYTINYFHLSFGKQDKFQTAVQEILISENLNIDAKKDNINSTLENSSNISTRNNLFHFDKNVPHWFLSPWFPNKNKKEIYAGSQSFENKSMYALHSVKIVINPEWIEYLQLNSKIIKDFCFWNLALFLQSRNPNVPDIPNKLIKPPVRNGLTKQTNQYWKLVFEDKGFIECIFTGNKLTLEDRNFALDHFIPHAFVSHDLIWNLVPIDKNFNSSKSDKLPSIEVYFDKFFSLQKMAFEIVKDKNPKNKFIEDYLTIFPILESVDDFNYLRYKESVQPLMTIASNNGFLLM